MSAHSVLPPPEVHLPSFAGDQGVDRHLVPGASNEEGGLGVQIIRGGCSAFLKELQGAAEAYHKLGPGLDVLDSLEGIQAAALDELEIALPKEHVEAIRSPGDSLLHYGLDARGVRGLRLGIVSPHHVLCTGGEVPEARGLSGSSQAQDRQSSRLAQAEPHHQVRPLVQERDEKVSVSGVLGNRIGEEGLTP
jgi:hypothetical protein